MVRFVEVSAYLLRMDVTSSTLVLILMVGNVSQQLKNRRILFDALDYGKPKGNSILREGKVSTSNKVRIFYTKNVRKASFVVIQPISIVVLEKHFVGIQG